MSARDRYRARTSAAGVGTNISGITGPIRDVKAEAESFERNIAPQVKQQVVDTFNRQRGTNQRDTYFYTGNLRTSNNSNNSRRSRQNSAYFKHDRNRC